jgi:hypothetical protein
LRRLWLEELSRFIPVGHELFYPEAQRRQRTQTSRGGDISIPVDVPWTTADVSAARLEVRSVRGPRVILSLQSTGSGSANLAGKSFDWVPWGDPKMK